MNQVQDMLIIIADDDPDDINLVIEALQDNKVKCKAEYVKNGQELLDLLEEKSEANQIPDLILLDINMHVMDGLSALEKIRASIALRDLPIYILSTTIRPDYLKRAEALGVNRYYQKPPHYHQLKTIIREVCDEVL